MVMRLFSAVVVVLTIVLGGAIAQSPSAAPQSGCPESIDEIRDDLEEVYGEANCGTMVYDNFETGATYSMKCAFDVTGYTSSTEYWYSYSNPDFDERLSVTSTYLDGGSSMIVLVDFENNCFDDAESLLSTVQSNRLERDCSNSAEAFTFKRRKGRPNPNKSPKSGKQMTKTCEDVAKFKARRMTRFCDKYEEAAEACRGICRTGGFCKCEQNPNEFPLKNGSTMTCTELAAMETDEITKKCRRFRFRRNCPAVCGCTISDLDWAPKIAEELEDGNIVLR